MRPRSTRGFTLIELLVVLARNSAYRGSCLSNLHQIAIANQMFMDENNDRPPLNPTDGSKHLWKNWNHGGRYPLEQSTILRRESPFPYQRPLNPYVHPNLPLGGRPVAFGRKGLMHDHLSEEDFEQEGRFEFPIFECPADDHYNWQENCEIDGTISLNLSAYHAAGTSYFYNDAWTLTKKHEFEFGDEAELLSNREGMRLLRKARQLYASRFVIFVDDPADWTLNMPDQVAPTEYTHHGTPDQHAMSFFDGHALMLTFQRKPNGRVRGHASNYPVLFPEQLR